MQKCFPKGGAERMNPFTTSVLRHQIVVNGFNRSAKENGKKTKASCGNVFPEGGAERMNPFTTFVIRHQL